MTFSHTEIISPSPWRVESGEIAHQPVLYLVRDSRGRLIAKGAWHGSNDECFPLQDEMEANIRLIAAAPDLLWAAKFMLAARDSKASIDAVIALRDAIAKAEGRRL